MFTAKMQYALVLLKELHELNRNGNLGPVKLKDVAEKHGLKKEFLDQVARKLRLKGYVESIKGPGGGYVLNKFPEKALEVYFCVQPELDMKMAASGEAAQEYLHELHDQYVDLIGELKL